MKKTLGIGALAGLLFLTACSGTETTTADPNIEPVEDATLPEPTNTPTPEQDAPAVEFSERGSIVLEPGEPGGIVDAQNTELVTFVVNSIEVDPQCTGERADDPDNGHFVVFDVEIESDIAAADHYVDPGLIFNTAGYRVIDEDGTTRSESPNTGPAHICFPEAENLPINIGPGEKASGKVVFDVPVETGILLTDLGVGENTQWEWHY